MNHKQFHWNVGPITITTRIVNTRTVHKLSFAKNLKPFWDVVNKYHIRGAGSVLTSIIHQLWFVNDLFEPWLGTVYKFEGTISLSWYKNEIC